MTFCIESYEDNIGLEGDILQDKYESIYRIQVLQPLDSSRGLLVFSGTYSTIQNARRAVRRHMNAPVVKTFDIRDNMKKGDK